ncbi:MAG: thioredoxin family protein [Opitutales bacterium]|nr:thioredoxin family protein [Opitutales bacterium]
MVATSSTMLPIGTTAPNFHLPDVRNNQITSIAESTGEEALLIAFVCNHCPYVLLLLESLTANCHRWIKCGVKVLFISSNDSVEYPADSPQKMRELAVKHRLQFPYLFDDDQSVAKSYRAACTPDFFLFDKQYRLFYRGQYDEARPGNEVSPNGRDLTLAVELLLAGKPSPKEQKPSIGCNVKWKRGNEPEYFQSLG